MIRTEEWKLNLYDGTPGDLYNLKSDPQEFYNKIADPDCADTVKSLMNGIKKWSTSGK